MPIGFEVWDFSGFSYHEFAINRAVYEAILNRPSMVSLLIGASLSLNLKSWWIEASGEVKNSNKKKFRVKDIFFEPNWLDLKIQIILDFRTINLQQF